jgi:hypothetical protein
MATCTTSDLLQEAACFSCLSPQQLELVKAVLLCRILQNNDPMASCDVQSLLDNANCFSCLFPFQIQLIQTQLLCEILSSGGAAGDSCLMCGAADPVAVPTCDCALYYNRSTGSFWFWDAPFVAWVRLIGP